jgi:hypothetical protein
VTIQGKTDKKQQKQRKKEPIYTLNTETRVPENI